MKKQTYIFKLFLIIIIPLLGSATLMAQTFSNSRSVTKTYKADNETTVDINNKYGKVHVIPWQKDSLEITASIKIYSNNLNRLEKIKDGIDFKFTQTKYYISATTDFGSSSNQILTELKNLSGAIIPGQNQIEINYMIYCPAKINLNIINKFGDIYIDDIVGKLKISLSNGDLKINNIDGEAQIELAFGSGIINKISDGQFTVSYSDVNIKNAKKLSIDSKSSSVNIDNADFIKASSRRDKYFFSSINDFFGNSEFSQIWIDKLNNESDFNMKYGSITISEVEKNFSNINLGTEFTNVNINFSEGSKYEADIFYPDGATANFPVNKSKYGFKNEREDNIQWHASYKTASGDNLPKLRLNALQKSYISILEK